MGTSILDNWERLLEKGAEGTPTERHLVIQQAVTHVLAASESLDEALPAVLRAVCLTLDWQFGAAWSVDAESGMLRCDAVWHEPTVALPGFERLTRTMTFARGVGLPGRVWESRMPAFIPDVTLDENFPRARMAEKEGLHGAIAFPVLVGDEIYGCIEFFSVEIEPPDENLMVSMGSVGLLVGQFILRTRAVQAVRASEARKAAVVDSALDCVIGMDQQGRITEFNPAAERTFGHRREDVLGRLLADVLVPPSLREGHNAGLTRYLATGEGKLLGRHIEMSALHADGHEIPVELAVTRVALPGPAQFVGYLRDVSERRRAEQERSRILQQLEHAVRARDEFLSIASHELRTPLTALLLQLQMVVRSLGKPNLGEEISAHARMVDLAVRQAQRLSRLINSLLDVSRIASGRFELNFERFDFADAVGAVLETFSEATQRADCTLTYHEQSGILGAWDRLRLEQVVTNLVGNALKYAPGSPVVVTVRQQDNRAILTVRDHGDGIPAERVDRVFDRFERVGPGASLTGLGLGLYITREIVHAHRGTVRLENQADGGCLFTVELPLEPPNA